MTSRPFTAYGQPLALDPRAFGMMIFEAPEPPKAKLLDGGVALVEVQGPLMHHPDPCADSYDAIKARVLDAIEQNATKIVLSIDSPGGLVSGCFDTADEIRAICDARNVELHAYIDGQATSAAYALACVASRVYVPPTGIVGSIGVIDALVDATTQDREMGLGFTIVASGARKADGNPHAPTTDAAVASAQARVDALADLFFRHVASHRPIAVDVIASMQAGLFVGDQAMRYGLADGVMTLDQVLALVRSGADVAAASAQPPTQDTNMDDNEKAYRASLQAVIDDEKSDDKAKAKAKAILAAMDGEEPDSDDKPEGKAEGDGAPADKDHKEPDGDEAKAMAARALALAERGERARIMAMRPDLTEDQCKAVASVPLDQLERVIGAFPRLAAKPAATAVVQATRGEGQDSKEPRHTPESLAMAQAMGLAPVGGSGVVRKGSTIYFHAQTAPKAEAGAR